MTLKTSLYILPKFGTVPITIVLILVISSMVNDTVLNFGKRYEDDLSVKVGLKFGCAKQSKNLEKYLVVLVCTPLY